LALALEADRLSQPLDRVFKSLRLTKIKLPQRDDLMRFLRRLRAAMDNGHTLNQTTARYFGPALERAAKLELTRSDAEAICETLGRAGMDPARLAHARAAIKRWPDAPLFEAHRVEAQYEGRYWTIEPGDIHRLQQAYQQADSNGDMRALVRLRKLLSELDGFRSPAVFFQDEEDDYDDDIAGNEIATPALNALLGEIGIEGVLDMLANSGASEELEDIQRIIGHEGTAGLLEALMSGAPTEAILNTLPPETPPPPPKTRRRRRKGAAPVADTDKDADDDDRPPPPRQLDLF